MTIDWPYTAEVFANVAAIATAFVAVIFFAQFHLHRRSQRRRLEKYLKAEEAEADRTRDEEGARTLLHLVKNLGMSESDIIDASFRSKCVRRLTSMDEDGKAARLLLVFASPAEIAEHKHSELRARQQRPSWRHRKF